MLLLLGSSNEIFNGLDTGTMTLNSGQVRTSTNLTLQVNGLNGTQGTIKKVSTQGQQPVQQHTKTTKPVGRVSPFSMTLHRHLSSKQRFRRLRTPLRERNTFAFGFRIATGMPGVLESFLQLCHGRHPPRISRQAMHFRKGRRATPPFVQQLTPTVSGEAFGRKVVGSRAQLPMGCQSTCSTILPTRRRPRSNL